MSKNSQIISVSVPPKMAEFLDEQDLSASGIIQEAILDQMRLFEAYHNKTEKLVHEIQFLHEEIGRYCQFLEEIQQFDNWRKWRNNVLAEKNTNTEHRI